MNYHKVPRLLYRLFIAERPDAPEYISNFAKLIDRSETQVRNYISGASTFPLRLAVPVYHYTGDDAILHLALEGSDRFPAPRAIAGKAMGLELEAMEACAAIGQLHAKISQCMDDGVISEIEGRKIERVIDEVLKQAEETRIALRQRQRRSA